MFFGLTRDTALIYKIFSYAETRRGGGGNRIQIVFAAANYVTESDCGKFLQPNVFVAAPFYLLSYSNT